jgi:hypothetical protein
MRVNRKICNFPKRENVKKKGSERMYRWRKVYGYYAPPYSIIKTKSNKQIANERAIRKAEAKIRLAEYEAKYTTEEKEMHGKVAYIVFGIFITALGFITSMVMGIIVMVLYFGMGIWISRKLKEEKANKDDKDVVALIGKIEKDK